MIVINFKKNCFTSYFDKLLKIHLQFHFQLLSLIPAKHELTEPVLLQTRIAKDQVGCSVIKLITLCCKK